MIATLVPDRVVPSVARIKGFRDENVIESQRLETLIQNIEITVAMVVPEDINDPVFLYSSEEVEFRLNPAISDKWLAIKSPRSDRPIGEFCLRGVEIPRENGSLAFILHDPIEDILHDLDFLLPPPSSRNRTDIPTIYGVVIEFGPRVEYFLREIHTPVLHNRLLPWPIPDTRMFPCETFRRCRSMQACEIPDCMLEILMGRYGTFAEFCRLI